MSSPRDSESLSFAIQEGCGGLVGNAFRKEIDLFLHIKIIRGYWSVPESGTEVKDQPRSCWVL